MHSLTNAALAALVFVSAETAAAQQSTRTLVAVLAHADDEGAVAPILARYAREGVQVYMIVATDGAQGGANTSIPRGPELARVREEEARCAARELGIHPPILLGFPDGKLGDYVADPLRLYRVTQQLADELQRLRPDAMITWGPDGGYGHPDHRIVSNLVTQLQRAGAPGVPERLFYMYLTVEAMRAMNPQRGEPPLLIPQAKYFTIHVPFTPEDLDAGRRSMACHDSQFTPAVIERVFAAQAQSWNGVVPLIPAFDNASGRDLLAPPERTNRR